MEGAGLLTMQLLLKRPQCNDTLRFSIILIRFNIQCTITMRANKGPIDRCDIDVLSKQKSNTRTPSFTDTT